MSIDKKKSSSSALIIQEYERRIFLNKLGLRFVGIWPFDEKEESNRSRLTILLKSVHLFVVYFLIISILIPQWLDMYCLWGDINAYTETLMSNVFIIAVMIKLSNFIRFKRIFKKVLEKMRSNWMDTMKLESPNSNENKRVMRDLSIRANDHSLKYGFMILCTALMYIAMPVANNVKQKNYNDHKTRSRNYPFFGRYFFDQYSDFVYYFCYMSQMISGFVVGVANFATDTIFLVCIYHFCAQLRVLQNELRSLGIVYKNKKMISVLIQRHQLEVRNAQALQTIFSSLSLQQIFVSCLMICVNGFKLIVSLKNRDVEFMVYLVCMPLTLFQIFFYCLPGNEMVIQSKLLSVAVYQSSWINLEPFLVRHLIFMVQRSQKPLAITAGKIYVLSLENFMKILKTSISALSVLQAVYKKS